MASNRVPYPSKTAWARARAVELRAAADVLAGESIPASEWRRVRQKMESVAHLRREAARFDRIAEALARRAA